MADQIGSILVDVNVFIDVLEKRAHWENSLAVIVEIESGRLHGFISASTILILYFRRSRIKGDRIARKEIQDILRSFGIVSLDGAILRKSLSDARFDDVEDAIQFLSALNVAEAIITRNKVDFRKADDRLAVLTPEEFIRGRV